MATATRLRMRSNIQVRCRIVQALGASFLVQSRATLYTSVQLGIAVMAELLHGNACDQLRRLCACTRLSTVRRVHVPNWHPCPPCVGKCAAECPPPLRCRTTGATANFKPKTTSASKTRTRAHKRHSTAPTRHMEQRMINDCVRVGKQRRHRLSVHHDPPTSLRGAQDAHKHGARG